MNTLNVRIIKSLSLRLPGGELFNCFEFILIGRIINE